MRVIVDKPFEPLISAERRQREMSEALRAERIDFAEVSVRETRILETTTICVFGACRNDHNLRKVLQVAQMVFSTNPPTGICDGDCDDLRVLTLETA